MAMIYDEGTMTLNIFRSDIRSGQGDLQRHTVVIDRVGLVRAILRSFLLGSK